jgi:exo-beta-1,3-glucanase (GH17 family)
LALLLALLPLTAWAQSPPEPVCNASFTSATTIARMADVVARGRFIAYQPVSLRVIDGHPTHADAASIREDLKTLRPKFDGLITYTAVNGAEAIPGIAASLGYHAIIIGVWDPFDDNEINAALEQARRYPKLVAGLSLGNEVLFAGKHELPELAAAVAALHRRVPQLPLSTTEPFHLLDTDSAKPLLRQLDFLLPIVHPVFQPWFRTAPDANAAQFVVNVVNNLALRFCGLILVKEVGEPTAPAASGLSPQRQASFFAERRKQFPQRRMKGFAYFSAFDAPWRAYDELAGVKPGQGPHEEEAHWGLYDENRKPKPVVSQLP